MGKRSNVLFVRHQHNREPLLAIKLGQQFHNLVAARTIEVSGRFISQKQ